MYDIGRFEELEKKIASLPRVSLATFPTPLEEAPRLSSFLGGPRIFIKRDDHTGLAFGGNKARMVEFRLASAVNAGADTVIAGYGLQSNHARQIAAGCAKLGLDCKLVLKAEPDLPGGGGCPSGNTLLHELLGAEVIRTEASVSDQIEFMRSLAGELEKQGRKPFISGVDDYELSTAGYVACMLEMCRQFTERGVTPDVITVCSDGPTQAGLVCAAKYLRMQTRVIGISPMTRINRPGRDPDIRTDVARLANLCARRLGIEVDVHRDEIENHTRYVGEGYGKVSPEALEAIRIAARTEALLLDPVYTGKAMAGLIDLIRRKEIGERSNVVFIHTGGGPLVFLYGQELAAPAMPENK